MNKETQKVEQKEVHKETHKEAHKAAPKVDKKEDSKFIPKSITDEITKDGIVNEVKKAIAILSLKEADIKAVASSKKSEIYGALMFLAPIVINTLLMVVFLPYFIFGYTISMLVIPVGAFVGAIFLTMLVADKGFKMKLDVKVLFRVMSYASIAVWPSVLVYFFAMINLGALARIFSFTNYLVLWVFVVLFIYLSKVVKMKQNDAIIVSVASGFSYFVLLMLLGKIFMGNYYGMGMGMYF